jgi:hypothetical protein
MFGGAGTLMFSSHGIHVRLLRSFSVASKETSQIVNKNFIAMLNLETLSYLVSAWYLHT